MVRGEGEPSRVRPGPALSSKMSRRARRDTAPELTLRKELHRRGLRYRVQLKVPGNQRRTIDVAFTRARLAVYIDGCFWHGCPEHFVTPKTRTEFWLQKIEGNRARDRDTDFRLKRMGLMPIRIWEHVDPGLASQIILDAYRTSLESL